MSVEKPGSNQNQNDGGAAEAAPMRMTQAQKRRGRSSSNGAGGKVAFIVAVVALVAAGAFFVFGKAQKKIAAKKFYDEQMDSFNIGSKFSLWVGPGLICESGDMDLIEEELAGDKNAQVLLTLEPILKEDDNGHGFKPIVKKLHKKKLFRGVDLDFKVKHPSRSKNLGLFMCTDKAGTGRCSDKPGYSMGKLQERYFFDNENKAAAIKAKDKLLYFQYVHLEQNRVDFLTAGNTEKSAFRRAQKLIRKTAPNALRKKMEKKVKALITKMGSGVLQVRKRPNGQSHVKILLAKYDKKNCEPKIAINPFRPKTIKRMRRTPKGLLPKVGDDE